MMLFPSSFFMWKILEPYLLFAFNVLMPLQIMRVSLSIYNPTRKSISNKNKIIDDSESKKQTILQHITASVTWSSFQMKNISEKKTGFKKGWMYVGNTLLRSFALFLQLIRNVDTHYIACQSVSLPTIAQSFT